MLTRPPRITKKSEPIFARLTTGEIIRLTKDCNCCCHDGPHFLWADNYWKNQNHLYAEEGKKKNNPLIIESAAYEETRRLQEKQRFFRDRNIEKLLTIDEVPQKLRNSTGMKFTIRRLIFTESYDSMVALFRNGTINSNTFRAYCAVWTWANYRFSGAADIKQTTYQKQYGMQALKKRINKVRVSFGFNAI